MDNKIKCIGYTPLHYGKFFLRESLLSVVEVVDKFVVLYSPKPSYGFGTDAVCPDTEYELKKIATEVLGDKLIWHNQNFGNEGEHRSFIYNFTDGFDICIAIDADEIFKTDELKEAINVVYNGDKWHYGVQGGYKNFWKSFNFYCADSYAPVRLTNLHNINNNNGEGTVNFTVYHFSCAQPNEVIFYKYKIHGHANELRINWLQEVYFAWTPQNNFENLHPVANGIWNAVPFLDKEKMPSYLKEHPFFNLEIIE